MGKLYNRFLDTVNWLVVPPGELVLRDDEVHIYRINIADNLHLLDKLKTVLTPAEIERGNKYHQLKDSQRFTISRGVQRHILARYLNIPPEQLRFEIGANKKPYLVNAGGEGITYNITHSDNWIILAIALSPVGADVEKIDPGFPYQDILGEHFSTAEVNFINQQNSSQRFFLLWTRKEAFLKATGQGLGEHLKITASLDGDNTLTPSLTGAHKNWQVSSFKLGDHFGSVACGSAIAGFKFWDVKIEA